MAHNSKKNFNWVLIAVILSCAAFLAYQYLMVEAADTSLSVEDAEDQTNYLKEENTAEGDLERLPQVDAFLRYVSQHDPENNGIFDGNYTQTAFDHFTDALKSIAEQKEVQLDASEIANLEDQFDQFENADEKAKPEQLKNVLMAASGLLASIQIQEQEQERFKSELEQLQQDAQVIDENKPIEEQSKQIEEYFEQAALVLETVEESV